VAELADLDHAWTRAGSREEQAAVLHDMGGRCEQAGEDHRAAGFFELARALRRGFVAPDLLADSERALARVRDRQAFDAIVLSGGAGRRFGGRTKPEQRLAGWPLIDHVLLACCAASTRVVVGPERRGLAEPTFCREQPAGSGPVAGIAVAVAHGARPVVAVLAADLPFVRAGLDPLTTALVADADVAVLVDTGGRLNYLASLWRRDALLTALAGVGDPAGAAVRALYRDARGVTVPDFDAAGADVDTPNDLASAEERVRQDAGQPTAPADPARPRRPRPRPQSPLAWPELALHSPS
jgi:molybdopterin-guanine dinucleotide biosynthesis protein A